MSALAKIGQLVSERGIGGTLSYVPGRALEIARQRQEEKYDRTFNIDTGGINALKDIPFDNPHRLQGLRYEGMSMSAFRTILNRLRLKYERYTFIDYGSGKGRVLFLAAERPFKRIIGVEFAPQLHEVALRNIATYRNPAQRCLDIQVVCADAVEYEPPPDPLVMFFYSPFKPPVFDLVLTTLKRSLDCQPRPAVLIFFGRNPDSIRLFEQRWPSTTRNLPLPWDWSVRGDYKAYVTHVGSH